MTQLLNILVFFVGAGLGIFLAYVVADFIEHRGMRKRYGKNYWQTYHNRYNNLYLRLTRWWHKPKEAK